MPCILRVTEFWPERSGVLANVVPVNAAEPGMCLSNNQGDACSATLQHKGGELPQQKVLIYAYLDEFRTVNAA